MNTNQTEKGAAEIRVKLADGSVTVYHHEGATLAELENAPEGTWDKLWDCFRELGFDMRYGQ